MKQFLIISGLLGFLTACNTTEERIGGAAVGAGAGAAIAGPVGAIAGGAVGVVAGPPVTNRVERASRRSRY